MSDNPMMFTYINETITMDEWELKIVFLFFSRICLHPKCCLETKGGRKNIYYDNKSKATAVVFNDVRVCLRVCVTGEIKKETKRFTTDIRNASNHHYHHDNVFLLAV